MPVVTDGTFQCRFQCWICSSNISFSSPSSAWISCSSSLSSALLSSTLSVSSASSSFSCKVAVRSLLKTASFGALPKTSNFVSNVDWQIWTYLYLADGKLHHVCATWKSSSGQFKVYKDGALVKTIDNVKTGEKINTSEIWVTGQDQDSLGGGFHAKDSYKGILAQVSIWNTVLPSNEIENYAKNYGLTMQGSYKAFNDFDISNATELIKPSCCPLGHPLSEE